MSTATEPTAKPRNPKLPGSLGAIRKKIAYHEGMLRKKTAYHEQMLLFYTEMEDTFMRFHSDAPAPKAETPVVAPAAPKVEVMPMPAKAHGGKP